jgi:hypothetical protein
MKAMDLGCSVGLLAWEMFVGLAVYQATFVLLCSQCFISFYLLVVGEIYQSPVMCAGDWWGHRTQNIIYARI